MEQQEERWNRIGIPESQKEVWRRLKTENFTYDPKKPDVVDSIANQLYQIDTSRFGEGDPSFTPETFKKALIDTAPNEENKGKTTTVVLVTDPKDNSVFGFCYTEPAEVSYYSDPNNPENSFHPERLNNPNIAKTAYVMDMVCKESGSGIIKQMVATLEEELRKKGYEYFEFDSAVDNGLSENIIKNFPNNILSAEEHDSPYGRQMFIRMK